MDREIMATSTTNDRWLTVLLEAAKNVKLKIREVLLQRRYLSILELKKQLDYEAQKAIRDSLTNAGYPISVISEEGDYTIGDGGPFLVVDPVDGTTNLARGIPFACTSIALSDTSTLSGLKMGLVKDLYTGNGYKAERNRGAWYGEDLITTSEPKELSDSVVSMDISKGAPIDGLNNLIKNAGHLRQMGSAALSLCNTASGAIDAYVDLRGKLRITDVAAGLLILEEAGGVYKIYNAEDDNVEFNRSDTIQLIAASSPETLEKILDTFPPRC
jgi:myo-inositol-1(or 4)-monophosphatase